MKDLTHAKALMVLMRQADAAKQGKLAVWTVYEKPADYPDGCIARRFEVGGGSPEPVATADTHTGTLDHLRDVFRRAGLYRLERQTADQPHVVECWI